MDYAALKAEIALSKYAGQTDEQIAAALASETVTVAVDVPVGTVSGKMMIWGIIPKADAWAAANPSGSADVLGAILVLKGMMASPQVQTIQMTDPEAAASVNTMLAGLVAVGIMTAEQRGALLGLASTSTTRAAQLGLDADQHDGASEIAAARLWPGVAA